MKTHLKTRYLKKRVNGVNVMVHRYLMEQHIGRKLLPNEVVHHINGDRHDNRLENLMIMDRAEHCRISNLGHIETPEQRSKISLSLIGNQRRKGIPHTEETKARIAASLMGQKRKPTPEEIKEKISDGLRKFYSHNNR